MNPSEPIAAPLEDLRDHFAKASRGGGPIYRQIATAIAAMIAAGRIGDRAALPAERDLAAALGVGRVTVRAALKHLSAAGLVEIRPGSGAFVTTRGDRIDQPLWRLSSFTEDMAARGRAAETRLISCETTTPSPEEAIRLGTGKDGRVLRILRLREAGGRPLALERASLPADVLPEGFAGGSLYTAMRAAGQSPERALQRLTAIPVDAETAARLEMTEGAPGMQIERLSWNSAGRVVEFTRSIYRGDAYDFIAELRHGH